MIGSKFVKWIKYKETEAQSASRAKNLHRNDLKNRLLPRNSGWPTPVETDFSGRFGIEAIQHEEIWALRDYQREPLCVLNCLEKGALWG